VDEPLDPRIETKGGSFSGFLVVVGRPLGRGLPSLIGLPSLGPSVRTAYFPLQSQLVPLPSRPGPSGHAGAWASFGCLSVRLSVCTKTRRSCWLLVRPPLGKVRWDVEKVLSNVQVLCTARSHIQAASLLSRGNKRLFPGTLRKAFGSWSWPGHFSQSLETFGLSPSLFMRHFPVYRPSTSRVVESGRDVSATPMCI
jgi:hypothetical protein